MPKGTTKRRASSQLAETVRRLREENGWSPSGLADRMAKLGCPIPVSAIYKIEGKGRKVDVDELVTFAAIFDVPVESLLVSDPRLSVPAVVRRRIAYFDQSFLNWKMASSQLETAKEYERDARADVDDAYRDLSDLTSKARRNLLKNAYLTAAARDALEAAEGTP